jgi:hypothetical protein
MNQFFSFIILHSDFCISFTDGDETKGWNVSDCGFSRGAYSIIAGASRSVKRINAGR